MKETGASSPWNDEPPIEPRHKRVRRMGEHLSLALIIAMAVVVMIATYPLAASAIEGYRPAAAKQGIERYTRANGWAVGKAAPRKPSRYAPTPERYRPRASSLLEEILGDPDEPFSADSKAAIAKNSIAMRRQADDEAEVIMTINRNATLYVSRDLGDWLLVAVSIKGGGSQLGWVRRSEVVILP